MSTPSDAVVGTSDSFDNSYEIVEFTASETGTYDAQVQARTYSGSEIIGFAKTVVALPGWDYRKLKTITGTTAQTNYQMKLTVYKASGTDTPGVVYLGGNVKDDFSDLRFTKSDGVTLLDYWIESYTSGVSAVVWVEVDSIPASPGTADIYLYYGNPSAASASNGDTTFIFFDDFPGTGLDTNKWAIVQNPSFISVTNSILTVAPPSGSGVTHLKSVPTFSTSPMVEYKARLGVDAPPNRQTYFGIGDGGQTDFIYASNHWNYGKVYLAGKSGNGYTAPSRTTAITSYHVWGFSRYDVGRFYVDYSQEQNTSSTYTPAVTLPLDIFAMYWNGADAIVYADWVRVRKYASPEPAWA